MTSIPHQPPPADRPVGTGGIRVNVTEKPAFSVGAAGPLLFIVIAGLVALALVASATPGGVVLGFLLGFVALLCLTSLQILSPGETNVVQFFGRYIGTVRREGFSWRLPLTTPRRVPVRVNNFETRALKVNDRNGSPVIISAVVVWQVADTAKSIFAVDDYGNFITTQAEAALRHVASSYPYDDGGTDSSAVTLRGNSSEVTGQLAFELAERITIAGLEVIEVRLSNLSYAPEIAGAMLQRQQAQALVEARRQIVQGAVSMTADALSGLEEQVPGMHLSEERRAQMTTNLMTVIVGSANVQPVINTGQ